MSKYGWIAVVAISVVVGSIIAFNSLGNGDRGNLFIEESITRQGGLITHQEYNPKQPLPMDKPFPMVIPTGVVPYLWFNPDHCTCFSTADATGSVPCETGMDATANMSLLVACSAGGNLRLERDFINTIETPATEVPVTEAPSTEEVLP